MSAFLTCAYKIVIPAHCTIEEPLSIADLIECNEETIIEKIIITIGEGARVSFVDKNRDVRVHIKHIVYEVNSGAHAEIFIDYNLKVHKFLYCLMNIELASRARCVVNGIVYGEGIAEFEGNVLLMGKNSYGNMSLVTAHKGNGFCMIKTTQCHQESSSESKVVVRQLVADSSEVQYESVVNMNDRSQYSSAYQNHKALLLTPHARALANPQLNVERNKEVHCSHGTAIGHIDGVHVWYLMTRGISYQSARALILQGFVLSASGETNYAQLVQNKIFDMVKEL